MKKFLYVVTPLLLVSSMIFFPELKNLFKKEAPVKKELSFAIAKENTYASQAYENAMASVHIVISKVKSSQKR